MKITFTTLRIYMTYEYYLKQPKSMLQWNIIKKLARNPNIIKNVQITKFTPLTKNYIQMIFNDNDDDDEI